MPRQHLQILSLIDDTTAKKMTSFSVCELQQLYDHFSLHENVITHNELFVLIGTDKWKKWERTLLPHSSEGVISSHIDQMQDRNEL